MLAGLISLGLAEPDLLKFSLNKVLDRLSQKADVMLLCHVEHLHVVHKVDKARGNFVWAVVFVDMEPDALAS